MSIGRFSSFVCSLFQKKSLSPEEKQLHDLKKKLTIKKKEIAELFVLVPYILKKVPEFKSEKMSDDINFTCVNYLLREKLYNEVLLYVKLAACITLAVSLLAPLGMGAFMAFMAWLQPYELMPNAKAGYDFGFEMGWQAVKEGGSLACGILLPPLSALISWGCQKIGCCNDEMNPNYLENFYGKAKLLITDILSDSELSLNGNHPLAELQTLVDDTIRQCFTDRESLKIEITQKQKLIAHLKECNELENSLIINRTV